MDFKALMEQSGITLTDEQTAQFDLYANLLIEWNQRFNLTAITDKEGIHVKHFLDSLLLKRDFKDGDLSTDISTGPCWSCVYMNPNFPELPKTKYLLKVFPSLITDIAPFQLP